MEGANPLTLYIAQNKAAPDWTHSVPCSAAAVHLAGALAAVCTDGVPMRASPMGQHTACAPMPTLLPVGMRAGYAAGPHPVGGAAMGYGMGREGRESLG